MTHRSYSVAAYIQVQYWVIGVHPTGLTVKKGCRQVSTIYDLISPCKIAVVIHVVRGHLLMLFADIDLCCS